MLLALSACSGASSSGDAGTKILDGGRIPGLPARFLAFRCDSADDTLSVQFYPPLQATPRMTVEFWFRSLGATPTSPTRQILTLHHGNNSVSTNDFTAREVSTTAGRTLEIGARWLNGTTNTCVDQPPPNAGVDVTDGQWHHIAHVAELLPAGVAQRTYVDGTLRSVMNSPSPKDNLCGEPTTLLLCRDQLGTAGVLGEFDDVHISRAARYRQDVGQSFEPRAPVADEQTLLLLTFDEDPPFVDEGPNAFTVQTSGSPKLVDSKYPEGR